MSKILHLKAENIQRIKVVEITPNGNLVVVGGNNGNGKTSLLDSIKMVLGGKRNLSDKPVREGADSGEITLETEDFIANRIIYPDGRSELEFKPKGNLQYASPQKFFDSILSKMTFDPLSFSGMEKKEQIEVIKSLIPFNFTGNENYRKNLYDERTFVNRELKQKEAENEANPFDGSFPVDEEGFDSSTYSALVAQQTQLNELNSTLARGKAKITELANRKQQLLAEIAAIDSQCVEIGSWIEANEPKVALFGNIDEQLLAADQRRIGFEERNARIRKNAAAKKIYIEVQTLKAKTNELTAGIDKLDAEKMAAIQAANLPVANLSFSDDDGVLYAGIPFAQLSGAERLKVSLAMGIALNPSLRVLLIRDGSLLDEENLRIVADMAAKFDMQVWLERVGKGEECSVVLEDGMVLEDRTGAASNGAEISHSV